MPVRAPFLSAVLLCLACASAPPPEPVWWAEAEDRAEEGGGGAAHVLHGGKRTGRNRAKKLVTITIPGDWRDRLDRSAADGAPALGPSATSIRFVAPEVGEEDVLGLGGLEVRPRDGVYVVSELEPNARQIAHIARATGAEVYLVRQEREGDVLRVEVCGLDGWPLEPVPLFAFDWEATELELRGWRPDPWWRAKGAARAVGYLALAGALIWGAVEAFDGEGDS